MNWKPWRKDLETWKSVRPCKEEQKQEIARKEDVERRLTYLEAQVRILKKRVEMKEQELKSG